MRGRRLPDFSFPFSYATFLSIFLWERKERARKKRKEKRADGRFAPARRPLAGQYEKQSHVGSEFFYVTRRYFSSGISFGKVAVTKRNPDPTGCFYTWASWP